MSKNYEILKRCQELYEATAVWTGDTVPVMYVGRALHLKQLNNLFLIFVGFSSMWTKKLKNTEEAENSKIFWGGKNNFLE